jgi:hypothetical protein
MNSIQIKNLPKLYINNDLEGVNDNKKLVLIGYGFTDKYSILKIKRYWEKYRDSKTALGRTLKETNCVSQNDVGGVLLLLDPNLKGCKPIILAEMDIITPMGLCYFSEEIGLLVGSSNAVLRVKGGKIIEELKNNLFSQVHVMTKTKNNTVIAACSNTDSLVEFNPLYSKNSVWEWIATDDNRFFIDKMGNRRSISNKINYQKLKDFGTRNHTTHINSVEVYDKNHVLSTLFHQGYLIKINKRTNKAEIVMKNLINPHSIRKTSTGYIVSDTKNGRVILMRKDLMVESIFNINSKWIQDSIEYCNSIIIGDDEGGNLIFMNKTGREFRRLYWNNNERKLSVLSIIKARDAKNIFLS